MSYRRRMEVQAERRRLRAADERFNRELYYSQRLRASEEIFSRFYERSITFLVKRGWVNFQGKNYRIEEIEKMANQLDARLNELGD